MPAASTQAPTGPEVQQVALEHARRGVALQVAVRWVLVGFVVLTVIMVPPAHDVVACALIAAGYLLWASVVAVWTRRDRESTQLAWLALFVDVVVLGVLTLLTGVETPQSWTSDVFIHGLLLIPVLAATQLRPWVCTAVVVPTAVVYLLASVATRVANEEPWSSLLLRTLIAAGVAWGCIGLSRIQRSRVATIGELVQTRTRLLDELAGIEQRERQLLSEHLHDGALQYVLAARLDLDDARDTGDPTAFDRIEQALVESSRLLRSTVAELHPAVLQRAGLPAALRDLTRAAAARGGFAAEVTVDDWPDDLRTPADPLLFRSARELLANVARHAQAQQVTVALSREPAPQGRRARLEVRDDGVGVPADAAARALGDGHIGLTSHAVRLDAAGGRLSLTPRSPSGTLAVVELPLPEEPSATEQSAPLAVSAG